MRAALCIAGPTASGKSELALRLAREVHKPVIVNCDSMQVYRDLSIITARPSKQDQAGIPHQLFGHRDGSQAYSVAKWRDEVRIVLADAQDATVVFVGGTGLYFLALLEGLSPIPEVDPTVREQVRARCELDGAPTLFDELDGEMQARLRPTDSQRVSRALEVQLSTGRSLAYWQDLPKDGGLIRDTALVKLVLEPDKSWLEQRISMRAALMFKAEGLAEVQRLHARGLAEDLPVMRALGVEVIGSYLQGRTDHETALDHLSMQTRRYAKRQMTWFRGHMADWLWCDPQDEALAAAVLNEIASMPRTG